MSVTELGFRGNTAGRMSEAGGVAHHWFYNILLRPHSPQRHPVKGKRHLKVLEGKSRQDAKNPRCPTKGGTVNFIDSPELTA